jgi:hypothetical protein
MTYVFVSDNPARTRYAIEKIKPNILDVDIVIPDVEISINNISFEDLSDHVHAIVNGALDAAYKVRNHCQFVIDIDNKDIMTLVASRLFMYSHIVTLDDRTRFRAERDYWTEAAVVIGDHIVLMD